MNLYSNGSLPSSTSSSKGTNVAYGYFHDNSTSNTSKSMMQFSDLDIPSDWPEFLPQSKVNEYLKLYVREFGLEKYIKYGRSVYSMKPQLVENDSSHGSSSAATKVHTGKWEVIYKKKERKSINGNKSSSNLVSLNSSFASATITTTTSTPSSASLISPPPSRPESPEYGGGRGITSIDIDRGVSIDYSPEDETNATEGSLWFSGPGAGGEGHRSSEENNTTSANQTNLSIDSILPPKPKKIKVCKRDVFDFVLVCTGHSWKPNVPLINGIEKFHGQVIHSSQYKV